MKQSINHSRGRGIVATGLALLLLTFASTAMANAVLQKVSHEELPGHRIKFDLMFSGTAAPDPEVFTTQQPPRIAVDFADTSNATDAKDKSIDIGAVSGLSVVSAGGRTRMVVKLLRSADYQTSVAGNTVSLVVGNGRGQTTGTHAAPVDPSKQYIAAQGQTAISDIDFRRGNAGQGRVIVEYNGDSLNPRIDEEEGGEVAVHLPGAQLSEDQAKRLDVKDFATPVNTIDAIPGAGNGAALQLHVRGEVTTSSYDHDGKLVIAVARKKKEDKSAQDKKDKKQYTGKRITFNFQNISVRAALQLLADVSNLNLVASDSVQGEVTLHLKNVPWDKALDIIMRANGLDKRRDGNVVWIAPQQELAEYEQSLAKARQKAANNAELESAYISISYGNAKDIAGLLTKDAKSGGGGGGGNSSRSFLSKRGSVSYDERTNTLLVHDTKEKIREIKNLVSRLDRPVRQVLIEARIVAATDTFSRDLGVKWGVQAWQDGNRDHRIVTSPTAGNAAENGITLHNNQVKGQNKDIDLQTGDGGYNVNLPITDPSGTLGLAILGSNYLVDLELQAAQTEGRTEIISSPRVITANQQKADIKQGQQIGYVTYRQGSGGQGGAGLGTATTQFKEAVLELEVTPTITADDRVYMDIKVKKDSLDSFINNPGGGQVPLLNTRSITTNVLVDNGQTVVLGGIYEVDKENSVTKVPGLGDLPIIGALFRKTNRSNEKAELLVFVTPRILSEGGFSTSDLTRNIN